MRVLRAVIHIILDNPGSGGHELTADVCVEQQERRVHPSVLIPKDMAQIVLLRVAVSQAAWTEGKTLETRNHGS